MKMPPPSLSYLLASSFTKAKNLVSVAHKPSKDTDFHGHCPQLWGLCSNFSLRQAEQVLVISHTVLISSSEWSFGISCA